MSYPGVMPAATQVARAFAQAGLLLRYETTLAFVSEAGLDRALGAGVRALFGARGDAQLRRRALSDLPAGLVHRTPGWELLRVAAARLGAGDVVGDRLWERMIERFDAGVARRLSGEVQAVYGYEHGCRASFVRARELGATRVFDMAAPHHAFVARMQAEQHAALPELRTAYRAATEPLDARRNQRKQAELELADLVIANSRFTAQTLLDTGYPKARVRVVPLAAPPVDRGWRERAPASPMRFLFAGAVAAHKGAHVLLEAWRKLAPGPSAELVIAGQWLLPERMLAALPEGAHALGRIGQEQLFEEYRRASVLVFPSLGDGFALVVAEALAHGLPVITTHHVGAADLLEEGISGFVLPPGDADALAARMAWCIDHGGELRAMREAAEQAAERRQWSDYRRELVEVVRRHREAHG